MTAEPNPLTFVTTEALFAELGRRFDAVLMVTSKQPTAQDEQRNVSIHGGVTAALGLVEVAKLRLRAAVYASWKTPRKDPNDT